MSVIGPRPALWNQDYLTAERDKYGANDVKPGLTGLAQISGRDELEIEKKQQQVSMRIAMNMISSHLQRRKTVYICSLEGMQKAESVENFTMMQS